MAGVNKVILIGNLGADPEVRHLENGSIVTRFNIATSERYKNREGQVVEQTEWHRIELWDNLAKIAEQYLKKGNSVYIEGKLRTEEWTDKEGIQRTTVRIRASAMTLLGSKNDANSNDTAQQSGGMAQTAKPIYTAPTSTPAPADFNTGSDADDLPF
jgi:single-strand DNA-binding protein